MSPHYRRARIQGGMYFFTVVTFRRRPILTCDAMRQSLREAVIETRKSHPFRIDAWVLLPDHLHCIWTLPSGDNRFSARWSLIKRYVSRGSGSLFTFGAESLPSSRRSRNESGIWQRRFWEHAIRDQADFNRHVDYIHWNPVKHGLVQRPIDWPWSTFHRFVKAGVYPADWGGAAARDLPMAEFGE